MSSVPGTKNVNISLQAGYPELQVMVDREKAGSMGFSVYQVGATVEAAFKGKTATRLRDPVRGKEYDVVVRLAQPDRLDKGSLEKLPLASPMGQNVALSNVARVQKAFGPIDIIRKNQNRIVTVACNVAGRPLNAVTNDLAAKMKDMTVPPGFTITVGGSAKEMKESFVSLFYAAMLALLLVYMILAAQFESLLDPFIVMFSVPLGVLGVIWALFLAGMNLSVTAFLGIIMMIGIVVSNAILLVDCTNQLRKGGMELHQAVVTAGRTRFRPILMTSVVTILAMIPMALGLGESGEMMSPMAVSVIGGLAVSMVLTLVLVPTLYVIFEERFKREIVVEHPSRRATDPHPLRRKEDLATGMK
jgi:multidrug efflux pump subunit AcrB